MVTFQEVVTVTLVRIQSLSARPFNKPLVSHLVFVLRFIATISSSVTRLGLLSHSNDIVNSHVSILVYTSPADLLQTFLIKNAYRITVVFNFAADGQQDILWWDRIFIFLVPLLH